jgi:hypothetical protein
MQRLAGWRMTVAIAAITAACAIISYLRFTPDREHGAGVARITPALRQLENPFIGLERGERSGVPNAMTWRLLPPVLGHVLRLPPPVYLWIPVVGVIAFAFGAVRHLYTVSGRLVDAAAGGLLVTTSALFFVGVGWVGQFDFLYVAALMLLLTSRSRLHDWALCSLGPWCDERFLLILPAFLSIRAALAPDRANSLRTALLPVTLALAPYAALRLYAINTGDLGVTYQILHASSGYRAYLPSAAWGWWMGLRLGWVPVLAAVWLASKRGGVLPPSLLLAGAAVITLLAWDVSRCASVLVPLMVVGCGLEPLRRRLMLPGLAALNLALPAAHVTEGATLYLRSILP